MAFKLINLDQDNQAHPLIRGLVADHQADGKPAPPLIQSLYHYDDSQGGYSLAPCLIRLAAEIASSPRYQNSITNLGELGDKTHQAQGSDSDHNPWLFGMIRAIDLGGDYDKLMEIKRFLDAKYGELDVRLYQYGYMKGPDSTITDWDNPGYTHPGYGDEGHLHISCGRDYNGCMSLDPWGLGVTFDPITPKPPGTPEIVKDPLEELMGWYASQQAFEQAVADQSVRAVTAALSGQPNKYVPAKSAKTMFDLLRGNVGSVECVRFVNSGKKNNENAVYLVMPGGFLLWLSPHAYGVMGTPPAKVQDAASPYWLLPIFPGTTDLRGK